MSGKSNKKEHLHISHCNHYLVTINAQEELVFYNSNFKKTFIPKHKKVNRLSEIISEADAKEFMQAFTTCISSPHKCVQGASRFINDDNEPLYLKWELVAEPKENGEILVYLVGHDMYEMLSKETEIERSRKILKAIFDSTDNVKFFIAPNFHIQFFNKKAYENGLKLHGRKMNIGDNILDYFKDTTNNIDQGFMEDFDRAIKGETVIRETEVVYNSNNKLCVRSEYYPVYEDGQLIGVSITVSDTTERNRYEENIRLQNEKLRKIAYIQSHQVRQPLTNILGILSFIKTDGISEDDRYLMEILKLSAAQLDSVIKQIVIEAQQIAAEPLPAPTPSMQAQTA